MTILSRSKRILIPLFIGYSFIYLYTFFHEGGHALLGVLFGGTLQAFDLNFWKLY